MRFMKILLGAVATAAIAGPALAADLPTRKGPAPAPYMQPVAAFSWTGPYIGGFAGGNWNQVSPSDTTFPVFGGPNLNSNGLTVGGLAGWNWGFNGLILGAEVEAGFDHKGSTATGPGLFGPTTLTSQGSAEGRARGRIGFGWDRWMAFVAGGATAMDMKLIYSNPFGTQEMSHWRGGWNLGGGAEWAFSDHWTLRGEYIYDRFGDRGYNFNANNVNFDNQKVPMQESTARAALIYKF
jgi:outer membrane immunogenic protein